MSTHQLTSPGFTETLHEFRDARQVRPDSGRAGTIMIVDDEPVNVKVVQKYLRDAGYDSFLPLNDSRQAIDLIRNERPDVILLDINMPHVTGLNILEVIRGDLELCYLPVLFLTASNDEATKSRALEMGVTDFLNKPINANELIPRIRNAMMLKEHHDEMHAYSKRLEHEVKIRTAELSRSREELIRVLACAAEYRDQDTGNHVLRVGRYARILARQLGLGETKAELIEQAAILHDVGKIGIPDAILHKPGRLTDDEMELMKHHCDYGLKILRGEPCNVNANMSPTGFSREAPQSPILLSAAIIAQSHHEKWDGSGYPLGLVGDAIPIEGRITAVADVFDALCSKRVYKDAMPLDRCFEIIHEGRGQHFDPAVVDAFFACVEDIVRVSIDMAD